MKVLLINPPGLNEIIVTSPAQIETERGHYPPLGLLYLASYAQLYANCEIVVIDAPVLNLDYNSLPEAIAKHAPDVVGLPSMTFTILDVIETVRCVRAAAPMATIVIGGTHATLFPVETLTVTGADIIVVGEGEETFSDLLRTLSRKETLTDCPGLVFRANGGIVKTGTRPGPDIEKLPFPARKLCPVARYSSPIARRSPVTTMFTSRGCPCRCTYCDRPALGKNARFVSATRVVQEFRECSDLGIREIFIYDDTFTLNRKRAFDICRMLQDESLPITWDVRTRVDTVDRHLLLELKNAGCERIHFGVESGSERVLKVYKKNISRRQIIDAFSHCHDLGITTFAYFMIGAPGETRQEFDGTKQLLREINPSYVQIGILCPFPGTEVFHDGAQRGLFAKDVWAQFAQEPRPDFALPYWEENMSRSEMFELALETYRAFYGRPRFLLAELMRLRSFAEFKRKAKAGIKLLLWN